MLFVGLRRELDSFPPEKVRQFIGNVSVALDVLEAFEVYGDELERKRRLIKQRRAAQHFLKACAAPTLARPYPIEINTELDYTLAGVTSKKGFFSTLTIGRLGFPLAKRPKPALGDTLIRVPVVIPSQVDMVPGQRRQVL
jgi:hypothetical protein